MAIEEFLKDDTWKHPWVVALVAAATLAVFGWVARRAWRWFTELRAKLKQAAEKSRRLEEHQQGPEEHRRNVDRLPGHTYREKVHARAKAQPEVCPGCGKRNTLRAAPGMRRQVCLSCGWQAPETTP